jgi:hypothetical protein
VFGKGSCAVTKGCFAGVQANWNPSPLHVEPAKKFVHKKERRRDKECQAQRGYGCQVQLERNTLLTAPEVQVRSSHMFLPPLSLEVSFIWSYTSPVMNE